MISATSTSGVGAVGVEFAVVPEPRDLVADLVADHQLVVAEAFEPLALLDACRVVVGVVRVDERLQRLAGERVALSSEC